MYKQAERSRVAGKFSQAEEQFVAAIELGGDKGKFCTNLFKIWRELNRDDLKKKKNKIANNKAVVKRVLRMLEMSEEHVKITDARNLLKAAKFCQNTDVEQTAQRVISEIEKQKS